jgi:hypothetical protein
LILIDALILSFLIAWKFYKIAKKNKEGEWGEHAPDPSPVTYFVVSYVILFIVGFTVPMNFPLYKLELHRKLTTEEKYEWKQLVRIVPYTFPVQYIYYTFKVNSRSETFIEDYEFVQNLDSCNSGKLLDCGHVAQGFEDKGNISDAIKYHRILCIKSLAKLNKYKKGHCKSIYKLLIESGKKSAAYKELEHFCQKGHTFSCREISRGKTTTEGKFIYHKKVCDFGDQRWCYRGAISFKNPRRSTLLKINCTNGHKKSCLEIKKEQQNPRTDAQILLAKKPPH